MGHYKANLRDIEFNLFEVLGRQDVLGTAPYDELDVETVRSRCSPRSSGSPRTSWPTAS